MSFFYVCWTAIFDHYFHPFVMFVMQYWRSRINEPKQYQKQTDVQLSVKMATENCNIRQYWTTNMSSADGASSVAGLIHELCSTITHYNTLTVVVFYLCCASRRLMQHSTGCHANCTLYSPHLKEEQSETALPPPRLNCCLHIYYLQWFVSSHTGSTGPAKYFLR